MENLSSLIAAMTSCAQMPGLSVLQHGHMVRDRYSELIGRIRDACPLTTAWRLPEWICDPKILSRLPPDDLMARYQIFHDCGKPNVLTIDADGRRHFPGHAEASERAFRAAGGDDQAARLIGMDMDIHLLKDVGVPEFASRPEAASLLLTGLAEIHSNAAMFGGIESISFKSKWKQIDRRGRAILRLLSGQTQKAIAS